MQSSAMAWGSKYGILAWWSLNLSEDVATSVVTFGSWRNVWSSKILKKSIKKITSWSRFEAYFAYFRCVRSQIIINMLPKIGRNSIWVSDSLDVFGESQNLRSPSWDLHWHDFRSPTGASVQFRHKLCRDILQQAEVCFFACYWFELWKGQPVEQAGSVDVKLLHLLEVSWSFPRHVSRQCMVEVTHGCFGVSGTHDFCFICEESPSLRMSFDFNSARVSRPGHLTLNGALEREPHRCSLLVKRS